MATTAAAPSRRNHFLEYAFYRDSWSHLGADQRVELRREYRFLRGCGVRRHTAKGVIYRVVNTAKGWDH